LEPAVIDAGLKVAVAPVGRPETLRATVCGDPDVTAVEMVLVPEPPDEMARLVGLAEIEKSLPVMVTMTVALCVVVPAVPLMVKVYVPLNADPALNVRVELLPAVTDVGVKLAVAPDGTPEAFSAMVCGDPDVTAVEITLVPEPFGAMLSVFGFAEIEKSLPTTLGVITTSSKRV